MRVSTWQMQITGVALAAFVAGVTVDRVALRLVDRGDGSLSPLRFRKEAADSWSPVNIADRLIPRTGATATETGDIDLHDLRELARSLHPGVLGIRLFRATDGMRPEDIRTAMESLGSKASGRDSEIQTALMGRWMELDPAGVLEFLTASKDQNLKNTWLVRAIGALADVDIRKAKEAIPDIEQDYLKRQAMGAVLDRTEIDDIDGTLRWIRELIPDYAVATGTNFHSYSAPLRIWDPYSWDSNTNISFINPTFSTRALTSTPDTFFGRWVKADPEEVWEHVSGIESRQQRESALHTMAGALATSSLTDLMTMAARLESESEKTRFISAGLNALVVDDPKTVASHVEVLPRGQGRMALMTNIASNWMVKDRQGAIAWLQALPDSNMRTQAMSSGVKTLSAEDPAAAARLLEQMDVGEARAQAINTVASHWAQSDLNGAIGWLRAQRDGTMRAQVFGSLAHVWASEEPPATIAFLNELEGHPDHRSWLGTAAQGWAQTDPGSAIEWAIGLESEDDRKHAAQSVINSITNKDPEFAGEMVEAVGFDGYRDQVGAIAGALATKNIDDAFNWVQSIPAGFRTMAAERVLDQVASTDPERAAALVEKFTNSLDDGFLEANSNQVSNVAQSWANSDVESAAAWVSGLPEGDVRDAAIPLVANRWVNFDPVDAAEWISELDPGTPRDNSVKRERSRNLTMPPCSDLLIFQAS
jgi:hypothetical protein